MNQNVINLTFHFLKNLTPYVFYIFMILQGLYIYIVLTMPHKDTSIRLILNVIIPIALFNICDNYISNNVTIVILRLFILIISMLILKYLKSIKYYS